MILLLFCIMKSSPHSLFSSQSILSLSFSSLFSFFLFFFFFSFFLFPPSSLSLPSLHQCGEFYFSHYYFLSCYELCLVVSKRIYKRMEFYSRIAATLSAVVYQKQSLSVAALFPEVKLMLILLQYIDNGSVVHRTSIQPILILI
jgi:hypothetical protein